MHARIVVMPGDGIGREVVPQGVKVLQMVAERFRHRFELIPVEMGYGAWKASGVALAPQALETCRASDGILHGATGAADSEYTTRDFPPGWGKRQLCRELGLRLSIRPMTVPPQLADLGPFKPQRTAGADFVIVRDMTLINKAGLAWAGTDAHGRQARDTLEFSEADIRPALKFAFLLAGERRRRLCLMTQSSLYATSRLWLELFQEMAAAYPQVAVEVQAPDNCVMQFARDPAAFDVIVTDNTPMGGMLNNLAALMVGSIGMAPGTTVGLRDGDRAAAMVQRNGLYEPIHGSAPLRAGQGIANPIGTVLAAALLLRHSLGLAQEAGAVEQAVQHTLAAGYRTYDIMQPGMHKVDTEEMGDRIVEALERA